MINAEAKKHPSLLKRRKRAILIAAAAILIIAIATVFILDYANSFVYVDPADGTEYYVKKRDGVFGLYNADGVLLEVAEAYSSITPHYITAAGTLVQVNPDTGATTTYAVVDTEDTEVFQLKSRLQIFPHITKANLMSVEVHNTHGSFTFLRMNATTGEPDASEEFALKESPTTLFDQNTFATLYVSAGNALTLLKLQDPDANGNGMFEEYGLVAETRIDENGEEYWYEPSYYIVTAVDGTKHKIIVGDRVIPNQFTASDGTSVSLGGYYVQYVSFNGDTEVKRNAVYVLDQNTQLMLSPIEDFITPLLTYPMTSTDYYNVENFKIQQLKPNASVNSSDDLYEETIAFSYIDMALREDTLFESTPFRFQGSMSGYTPSATTLDHALSCLNSPSYVKVCKFLPSEEDLAAYGLFAKTEEGDYEIFSKYMLAFDYLVKDQTTNTLQGKIRQIVLISEKNENGNYYAYTYYTPIDIDANGQEQVVDYETTYQTIIEIEGSSLAFLEWERLSWISSNLIDTDICFVKDITIETPDSTFSFELDNSLSDYTADMRTAHLIVNASNSLGQSLSTFGRMAVNDKYGYTWYITTTGLEVYAGSTKMEIDSKVGYYAYNALDKQARCRTGYIECADYRVEVNADTIRILYNNGKIETIVRYSTTLFRSFYETLVYSGISDTYSMTEEEEAALLNDPNALLMTITLHADDQASTENSTSITKVLRFYRISSRKAYITINGEGGFYVLTSRLEKILSDAQKFFDMQPIDPTAKT